MSKSAASHQPRGWIPLLVVSLLGLTFCTRLPSPASGPSGRPGPETGIASWYGPGFDGRPTSSREAYDRHAMTAAHPSLPFDTRVRVTNLDNDLATVVRINDRGPFVGGRIIDLSFAAANRIGMVGPGTARVRLEVLEYGRGKPAFVIQAGAYAEETAALAQASRIEPEFPDVAVERGTSGGAAVFRVRIPAGNRPEAERTAERLARRGIPALVLELSGR